MPVIIEKDVLIIGGGIAGLWILNRLAGQSFDVLLLDKQPLGSGQSIASQGMIHGGIKYALAGSLNAASQAIADMPDHWSACLKGQGDVDLQGTRLLSEQYFMWPRNSLRSRFNAFLGSKALRGKVSSVDKDDYPAFFRNRIPGPLYQLKDIVLDVPSLLSCLSDKYRAQIKQINWQDCILETTADGEIKQLRLKHQGEDYIIRARRYLITSGDGAKALLENIFPTPKLPETLQIQHRPLHMTIVKHTIRDPLYVHCVADQLTATPEVTITTHPCSDGRTAWYLGGELAESGTQRSAAEQNQAAEKKLRELFPWLDLGQAEWHSFFINRAEAKTAGGKRPESASIHQHKNLLLCWPSKLTLAPNLGQQLVDHLQSEKIIPGTNKSTSLEFLPFPGIALPPWEAAT
tara:strand:+ start:68346 stop:69560 length:1215 start_codon:yes stop_codon:yes gene_type:complete